MPLPSQRAAARRDRSQFTVLTVCTGNICRSPQAEQLLRRRLHDAFGADATTSLSVESAGTLGYDGKRMDDRAMLEAKRLGMTDTGTHRARRLRPEFIAHADLVLGMSREHRGAAASMYPSANRRAFALIEFGRITEALASGEVKAGVAPLDDRGFAAFMHDVVDVAATVRGLVPAPVDRSSHDIVDPYRLSDDLYRQSADSVASWVDRTVSALICLSKTAPSAGPRSTASS